MNKRLVSEEMGQVRKGKKRKIDIFIVSVANAFLSMLLTKMGKQGEKPFY